MTSATANIDLNYTSHGDKIGAPVLDAETIWRNGYCAIAHRGHATAGTRGYVTEMTDDVHGLMPVGFADQKVIGDGSLLASIRTGGGVVRRMTITDDAGTIADVMRLVYVADDQTFTLTPPTTIPCPVGITIKFNAVNDFDVYFFSFGELCAMSLGGFGRQTWCIGGFFAEAGASNADAIKGVVCPFFGYVHDYYLICGSAPADADVAGPVSLEIDGTDVNFVTTNPTINFADTLGLKLSGVGGITPVKVTPGSLIDVETDFTAAGTVGDGYYNVYLDIRANPGV
jgi:hypothetical protein